MRSFYKLDIALSGNNYQFIRNNEKRIKLPVYTIAKMMCLYEHNLINCPRKEAYNPIDILNILCNDGLIDRKKKYKIIKAYRLIKSLY